MGAEDHVDPWGLLDDRVAILLSHTAADGDLEVRVAFLDVGQLTEVSVETVVRVLSHSTGVEDDDIGLVIGVCGNIAGVIEKSGESFGVVDIHLAAVGLHLVAAR